jgi:hypothetical protein
MTKSIIKLQVVLIGIILLMCSCFKEDGEICEIYKGEQEKRFLLQKTRLMYNAVIEDTLSFKNNEGELKQFKLSRSEGNVASEFTFFNSEDDCNYIYYTNSDRFSFNYSNISESQNIYIDFYVGGYELKGNNLDSLIALFDYISFGGGNTSLAARFVTEKREDVVIGEEYFDTYLVTDTFINQINYDSIYILPNRSLENTIIYSIRYGVIQFENNGIIWDICL